MPQMFSRVAETFGITGRGVVVSPGISPDDRSARVLIGDPLNLRRPDGSLLWTVVRGMPMGGDRSKGIPVLLPERIGKADVPIGTEVWHMCDE